MLAIGPSAERAVGATIVASGGSERTLHFYVKVSPAREAQRAGPRGRIDDSLVWGYSPSVPYIS
jgi:hypothetical protein